MSTKTIYTSTITVPVYGSWKCEHCGEINFSTGRIVCKCQASTSSFRNSRHEKAKNEAARLAHETWVDNAYKIITDPKNNAQIVRENLSLENTSCTQCGKKPKWDKNMNYLTWVSLCLLPAFISGIVAFGMKTNVVAWVIFLALFSVLVISFISEPRYIKMMKNMPKEYMPVLGSLNTTLVEYAKQVGKDIPDPDKSIEIVREYKKNVCATSEKRINENIVSLKNSKPVRCDFCRKCGAQLHVDGKFCYNCGTKTIK